MKLISRRKAKVPAGRVRPGERVWVEGRARDVWRIRHTGAQTVTLDMHGVYLRLPVDQVVELDRTETGPRIAA